MHSSLLPALLSDYLYVVLYMVRSGLLFDLHYVLHSDLLYMMLYGLSSRVLCGLISYFLPCLPLVYSLFLPNSASMGLDLRVLYEN